MKYLLTLFVFTTVLFCCVFANDDEKEEIPDNLKYVTCGSYIKLKNKSIGVRLHSHKITYGSGSMQQSVTGFTEAADPNSIWFVRRLNKDGSFCQQG